MMKILKLDVQDGLGEIEVAVHSHTEAARLIYFWKESLEALAAPTPPVHSPAPGSWIPVGEAIKEYLSEYECDDGCEIYHVPNEFESFLIGDAVAGLVGDDKFKEAYGKWLNQTAPTPPAQDPDEAHKATWVEGYESRQDEIDTLRRELMREKEIDLTHGPRSIPPAQSEGEPVAWVDVKDSYEGPYDFHGIRLLGIGKHNLFTHPADDELRKAAEEFVRLYENESLGKKSDTFKELRKALEKGK